MRTLLILFSLVILSSCSSDLGSNPPTRPLLGKKGEIIVFNNVAETLSLFTSSGSGLDLENSVGLGIQSAGETFPCKAPNDYAVHEGLLYVVCSMSQTVHVFNPDFSARSAIFVGEGSNPWAISVRNSEKAYVSSFMKDEVVVVNPSSNRRDKVTKRISFSAWPLIKEGGETRYRPSGMALYGSRLYVAIGNLNASYSAGGPGYLAIINTETDTVENMVALKGRNAQKVLIPSSGVLAGKVMVLSGGTYVFGKGYQDDGVIDILSLTGNWEKDIRLGGSPNEVAEFGDTYFFANGMGASVLEYDAATDRVLPPIDLSSSRCGADSNLPLSYISSVAKWGDVLLATEFNSNCLIGVDPATGQAISQNKTGEGPELIWIQN